eukprot:CAMPEP_0197640420 /NCGR_PEP_ID=MMETSP1338-20131121/14717_1 /TAXON_ID=43686 ORGANISM="Pelagodinium beii, Strain RCC1491" /NCGR_SAMPLE_ID=MMETSP1338 /ASSEMBLY_ACC=CAM_ASM_000754 /LENGTH=390 /DNA_ID=CAMNT_0043213269 /DNA_START=109 /DNA_END=1281 /DNA_ORIENTATION=-
MMSPFLEEAAWARLSHYSDEQVQRDEPSQSIGSVQSWSYKGIHFETIGDILHLRMPDTLATKNAEDSFGDAYQLILDCLRGNLDIRAVVLCPTCVSKAPPELSAHGLPLLNEYMAALLRVHLPVLGIAEGCLSGTAISMLRSCDYVIADAEAIFSTASTTLDAFQASQLGLVHDIAASGYAAVKAQKTIAAFGRMTPEVTYLVKERLQAITQQRSGGMHYGQPDMMKETVMSAMAHSQLPAAEQTSMKDEGKQQRPQQLKGVKEANLSKRHDLADYFKNYDGPITALMVKNLPCSITQDKLAEAINSQGFAGKYDWLYLPVKKRRLRNPLQQIQSRPSNLGYAFVNFQNAEDAAEFTEQFAGYTFQATNSLKRVEIGPAFVQGSRHCPEI